MNPSWWSAFLDGDLDAFAQLIEAHQQDVRAIAYAVLLDAGLAEDVAQDTFITAWTRRVQLRDPQAVGGWLVTIARNRARDLLRSRRREVLVDDDVEIAAEASSTQLRLEREALRESCRQALARVPERYREVLVLYYAQERPVTAIATTLGITEAAAMQRLSRGRRLVERQGGELGELAGVRTRRSLATAVLALLALRRPAAAAPRPPFARWLVALGCVLATFPSDGAANAQRTTQVTTVHAEPRVEPVATVTPPDAAVASIDEDPSTGSVTGSVTGSITRTTGVARVVPAGPRLAPNTRRVAPPPPSSPAPAHEALHPQASRVAVVEPAPVDEAACATNVVVVPPSLTPASPPRRRPLDPINGLLETAGLPRAGDISFETVGFTMMVRAGLTEHVAIHAGMTSIDTDKGTTAANVGTAFGGGLKIGGQIAERLELAVLAEAANEVNVKALKARDGWTARSYAALTWRNGRHHATAAGGVIAEFDGTNRSHTPFFGLSTQLGWDDHLAFILESQYLGNGFRTKQTSLAAVRFRVHEPTRSILGIERARIDVGAIYLDRLDETDDALLPWLQVGLGW